MSQLELARYANELKRWLGSLRKRNEPSRASHESSELTSQVFRPALDPNTSPRDTARSSKLALFFTGEE